MVAKLTLPANDSLVGQRVCDITLPENTVLATWRGRCIIIAPSEDMLAAGDEMFFITQRRPRLSKAITNVAGATATLCPPVLNQLRVSHIGQPPWWGGN